MSINVGYGNAKAHYLDNREGFTALTARIDDFVSLVTGNCDLFLAVEVGNSSADYILEHLQAVDADWDMVQTANTRTCFFRPSLYTIISSVVIVLTAGDKRLTDYTVKVNATGEIVHALLTHLLVGSGEAATRKAEATQIANYAKNIPNCFLAGDFNEYSTSADSAKGVLNSIAGFVPLQSFSPTNAALDSWDGSSSGQWIDDILTKPGSSVSGAAMFPTGGASDHWGWLKADITVSDVAEGDSNGTSLAYIRRTGDCLHLIDVMGHETIAVPSGPQRWVPRDRVTAANPVLSTDTADLIAWHMARLGQFHYSQGTGRLDPDSSGVTDCSGLQYSCYKAVRGINIGKDSRAQADGPLGTTITTTRSEILAGTGMLPGDLIFYAKSGETWSHVEMYMGGSQVIGISNVRTDGPRIQALSLQVNYFTGKLKVLRYA